jgi:hypothetical protein
MLASSLGCAPPPPPPFELRVTATSDEGMTLPDLEVQIDGRTVGRTDERGQLRLRIPGADEGKRVLVSVHTPDGFRALSDTRRIALERITTRGGGMLPLELAARFSPLLRQYAVLIDVGRPALPVEVFGVQKAVTNSAGVAMFLVPGTPSDVLDVRVTNGGHPELSPRTVAQTFTLQDHADVLMLRGAFVQAVKKRVVVRAVRPHRL